MKLVRREFVDLVWFAFLRWCCGSRCRGWSFDMDGLGPDWKGLLKWSVANSDGTHVARELRFNFYLLITDPNYEFWLLLKSF